MKRDLVIGLVGAAVVAVAGLTALEWRGGSGTAPAPPQNAVAPPAVTAPPAAAPAPAASPSFDVVRINPQGEAVIAGRAAPGAEVSVLDGEREIGRVTADRNGEWVLTPQEKLAPGSHQLTLSARLPGDGAVSKSEGVVAMVVPEPTQSSAPVAVLLPGPGNGPARALQLPAEAGGERKFALDIIEYDASGKVQILGRAEPKAEIRIYLDNRLAGRGSANDAGTWSVILDGKVPVGRYRLRAEAQSDKGGAVARLALVFNRVAPPEGFAAVDVQPGNSLWRIAERSYGDGLRYTEIYQANRAQIRDPDLIYPGQVFAVPAAR